MTNHFINHVIRAWLKCQRYGNTFIASVHFTNHLIVCNCWGCNCWHHQESVHCSWEYQEVKEHWLDQRCQSLPSLLEPHLSQTQVLLFSDLSFLLSCPRVSQRMMIKVGYLSLALVMEPACHALPACSVMSQWHLTNWNSQACQKHSQSLDQEVVVHLEWNQVI